MAKRLGLKIEAKRLGGKRLGGKRLGGETSCYRTTNTRESVSFRPNQSFRPWSESDLVMHPPSSSV